MSVRVDKKTGLPLTWVRFGKAMFELQGNATEAYLVAFPKAKKWSRETIAWKAYMLKKQLMDAGWFAEILDMAGLTNERIAQNVRELMEAKETKFFAKDGVVISEREVTNHTARAAGTKLAMEAKKLLIQKQEIDANVNLPTSLTEWLSRAKESNNSSEASDDNS